MSALDPRLGVRVLAVHALHYTDAGDPAGDRPPHVRAASGMAFVGDRLLVVQDDASYLGEVVMLPSPMGGAVTAIALPHAVDGRRRFEVALGNKLAKLDLEACLALDGALWAFGSGSIAGVRDQVCLLPAGGAPRVIPAAPLYAAVREALGRAAINLEGAAAVGDELWLCHRGNTGPGDRPAIVRLPRAAAIACLLGDGPLPGVLGATEVDLGEIAGVALGFTDAVGHAGRLFYLAAAEASPDAIADGATLGSQLGAIELTGTTLAAPRAAALVDLDGAPLKAEALAFDPHRPGIAWVAADPDDPGCPAPLYELALDGPWL